MRRALSRGLEVFIDSNIFTYHLSGHKIFGEPCRDFLRRVERLWDEIHEPADLRQCGTTSPMISKYPTLRILCPTSFNRVSVSFRESSRFLSGAPNRHFAIELTVSEIERI